MGKLFDYWRYVKTYIRLKTLVDSFLLVVHHHVLEATALLPQYLIVIGQLSIVLLQELVDFLQLFDLQHSDFIPLFLPFLCD